MAKQTGHLWAVIQEWMDSMPYPPSQNKLAIRLGVSSSALGDYKYATHMPPPDFLYRLADEIRVPHERVLDAALRDHGYRLDDMERGGDRGQRSAPITQAARNTGRPTQAERDEAGRH